MSFVRNILRGSLLSSGVALGLIGFAGGASAQEATPLPADDPVPVIVTSGEAVDVGASSAQDDEAEIGDGLLIERPAPRPDPGNELRSVPAPDPTPAPAPAQVATPVTSGGVASSVGPPAAAATSAGAAPTRPTEVRGVQLERSATGTSASDGEDLARTGLGSAELTGLAGALLALGAMLIRTARPRRTMS